MIQGPFLIVLLGVFLALVALLTLPIRLLFKRRVKRGKAVLKRLVVIGLDGLAFSLVLIHAVHVLGGMVLLTTLSVRASVGPLSLQHLPSVRSVAIYWHFLEGV